MKILRKGPTGKRYEYHWNQCKKNYEKTITRTALSRATSRRLQAGEDRVLGFLAAAEQNINQIRLPQAPYCIGRGRDALLELGNWDILPIPLFRVRFDAFGISFSTSAVPQPR